MTQESPAMSGPAHSSSDRVRLARLALTTALAVPDVVRAEAGSGVPRVTADGRELLTGVSVIAQADGRYAIDLRLIARLVSLRPLADNIRARVQAAAARSGLAALLGSIDVEFADVLTADEIELPITTTGAAPPGIPAPPAVPDLPAVPAPPPRSASPSVRLPPGARPGVPDLPEGLE
jgi:hypothetical protein